MVDSLKTRSRDLVEGFWFVPGAVAAAFFGLAAVTIWIDRTWTASRSDVSLLYGGDAEAARDILTTIAGSLITVAGLTFSITVVTLQLVSSQFTPRVIRTFLGDRITQVVMGTFVGIFVYALVVLRAVRTEEDDGTGGFVPALGVALAIVLGVFALSLLLVFIHHTAASIRVSTITARVTHDTLAALDRLYPDPYGEPEDADAAGGPGLTEGDAAAEVFPSRPGYVQRIAVDEIAERLAGCAERFHVCVRPGDFVTETAPVLRAWPARSVDDEARRDLRGLVYVADERAVGQDVRFGVRQLADIALRAVSPSVNDPTTAVTCIGYVGAILERLAGRRFPERVRRWDGDVAGRVDRVEFEEFVDVLRELGRATRNDSRVTAAILAAAARAGRTAGGERRAVVARVADQIADEARDEISAEADRAEVDAEARRVHRALAG